MNTPNSAMKKYTIGLWILAGLTVALGVYVAIQGAGHKTDQNVNKALVEIAEDLNDYVYDEDEIPDSLSDATRVDIPQEIVYTKNSSASYTICVTYNGSSGGGLDGQDVLLRGLYGGFPDARSDYESSYIPSTLYVSSYYWDKGETCYDVEPHVGSSFDFDRFDSGTDDFNLDYLCEETYEYYEFYEDSCDNGDYLYD